jgi:signal transduction histidine kinase
MAQRARNRNRLVYLLGAYVLLQFFWWARLLVVQGAQLREARGEPARALMELPNTWMVIGEGTVFFVLLVSGWWMIERATRRELQAALRERNFLLAVTHELKTPIATTRLALQTILQRPLDAETTRELLTEASKANARLDRRITDLLASARFSRRSDPVRAPFHPSEIVRSAVAKAAAAYPDRRVDVALADGLPAEVWGDAEALELAWENLVENALKYSEHDVQVDVSASEGRLEVAVSDAGPGIPAADRRAVVEPFRRLERPGERADGGTGLGLYLADSILRLHRGTLSIRDARPGPGTRILTRLPLH